MTTFLIAPAGSRYLWVLIPVAALMAGVFIILFVSMRGARASRFEILPHALRLSGDVYGRTIPRQQIRIETARRVDFSNEPQLRPASKRMGTGLPGYQAGWFRLANGEKALLYLTDRSKAVYVQTTAGYSLLLSPADPDDFLATLRTTSR